MHAYIGLLGCLLDSMGKMSLARLVEEGKKGKTKIVVVVVVVVVIVIVFSPSCLACGC